MTPLLKSSRKDKEHQAITTYLKQYFGIRPKDIALYQIAVTHKSATGNNPCLHYERMEFLGDAILDAIIADHLFGEYTGEDEGELTRRKSKLVKREVLSQMAMRSGLNKLLIYSNKREINVETLAGNALEALIGAIYLEKGFKKTYKAVVDYMLERLLDDEMISKQRDFKSELIIWSQKEKKNLEFVLLEERKKGAHNWYVIGATIDGSNFGHGEGRAKKHAEQKASELALMKLTRTPSKKS